MRAYDASYTNDEMNLVRKEIKQAFVPIYGWKILFVQNKWNVQLHLVRSPIDLSHAFASEDQRLGYYTPSWRLGQCSCNECCIVQYLQNVYKTAEALHLDVPFELTSIYIENSYLGSELEIIDSNRFDLNELLSDAKMMKAQIILERS